MQIQHIRLTTQHPRTDWIRKVITQCEIRVQAAIDVFALLCGGHGEDGGRIPGLIYDVADGAGHVVDALCVHGVVEGEGAGDEEGDVVRVSPEGEDEFIDYLLGRYAAEEDGCFLLGGGHGGDELLKIGFENGAYVIDSNRP